MSDSRGFEVPGGLGSGGAGAARRLRGLLSGPDILILPGVADALCARLVERAGFGACFVTGAGFANASFGFPDVGLVTMSEIVDQVGRISDSVSIPVVADADNGYGGALSVMRTVRALERAGAAGIQLEDQPIPKRCGHFADKDLVSLEDMLAKVHAARAARTNPDTIIIGRTDAVAVEGFDRAIERARAFRDAGVDAVFVEAPTSRAQLERIPQEIGDVPLVVNIVEGGRTPQLPAAELAAMGYKIVLYANMLLRVTVKAAAGALEHLASHGDSSGLADRMVTWDERQELVDLAGFDALDGELAAQAKETLRADTTVSRR